MPSFTGVKKSFGQRQIPTILGISLLTLGLVAGLVMFSQGTDVFSPRATPATTPKNIKITNVTDTSFTVSFLTDEATPAFIKYGPTADDLKSRAGDDRDQLSGSIGDFTLHHITVRGLEPSTAYHYTLGTGSRSLFDNNGSPFAITTAKRAGAPAAAKTAYGSVTTAAGGPAEGAVVYLKIDGVGELSSLVKASGSWAIPLSNARTQDGSGYAAVTDENQMVVTVLGAQSGQTTGVTTTIAQSQPVATLKLGQPASIATTTPDTTGADATSAETATEPATLDATALRSTQRSTDGTTNTSTTTGIDDLLAEESDTPASPSSTASPSATLTTLDLTKEGHQTLTTDQPVITGKVAPRVMINIEVHSETEITQTLISDDEGNFTLDIAELSKNLEPGEHTVTYSYTDPDSGELITKTQTFTVAEPPETIALATAASPTPSPSPSPFGSGNPFPATQSASRSAQTASDSTKSARTSMPSTSSGMPVSGAIGTTMMLVIGGLFFIVTGAWSFWIAQEMERDQVV